MGCGSSRTPTGPGLNNGPSNRFRRDQTIQQNGAVIQRDTCQSSGSEVIDPDDEHVAEIIQGNPMVAKDTSSNIVRIFTSSTFTDTRHERNALMERVYPKLKVFCAERGYQFQVVDMRWGVRDEAANDHMTTELCMQELWACQRLSVGPNFVTFLSHKYGYRPLQRFIEADKFELMLTAVSSTENKQLLEKWYVRDDNAVPPAYILQSISTHCPAFLHKNQSKAFLEAKDTWWRESETIQQTLSAAAQRVFADPNEAHKYQRSVTENEIYEGILKVANCAEHCLWFNRQIKDINKQATSSILSRYTDCRGSPEYVEESKNLLQKLKDVDLPSKLPESCIRTYTVPWTKNAIDPVSCSQHKTYIDKLCENFESTLKEKISNGINKRSRTLGESSLVEEISQHAVFCQTKIKMFHGRQNLMDQVESFLVGSSTHPLVIHGSSGCGKTSIMAMAAHRAWELHKGKAVVILRFIGTSPDSTHIRTLLLSIISQLSQAFESNDEVPTDLKSLIEHFAVILHLATADQPLILVLDSLDQFSPENGARQLSWLPTNLPKHVKLLVSTLPEDPYECFPRLKMLLKTDGHFLPVPQLTSSDVNGILTSWLRQQNRALTAEQFSVVVDAFSHCPLPLFLKLCFDEACRWPSYMAVDQAVLRRSIQEVIRNLFQGIEKSHGHVLVSKALGYLTLSRNGLSEDELEDILSCDEEVLDDVYQYWTPPIRRLPPLLLVRIKSELNQYLVDRGADGVQVMYWYHRQFIEAAHACYCSDDNERRAMHHSIAEYFLGTWEEEPKPYKNHKTGEEAKALRYISKQPLKYQSRYNVRKLMELPIHVIQSQMLDVLKDNILCNLDWLTAKLQATSLRQILDDFSLARQAFPEENDLTLVAEALQLSHGALNYDPRQLPGQIVGRISQGVTKLRSQASRPPYTCIIPADVVLTPPGGALVHALSDHTSDINCLDLSEDGRRAITSSDDGSLKVWNVQEGRLERSIETGGKNLARCRLCLNNQCAILNDNSNLFLVKLDTSEIINIDEEAADINGSSTFIIFEHRPSLLVPVNQGLSFLHLPDAKIEFVIHNSYMKQNESYGDIGDLIDGHKNFIALSTGEKTARSNLGHEVHIADVRLKKFVHKVVVYQRPASEDDDDHTVDALVMTLDESFVITSDFLTNDLHFISTATGQVIRRIPGNEKDLSDNFHITPDGSTLYFANSKSVCLWDIEGGTCSYQLQESTNFMDVRTVDKKQFVTIGSDAVVRIWDVTRGTGSNSGDKVSEHDKMICWHMERIPDSSQYILFALQPDSSNKSASRTIGLYDVAQEVWMPQVTVSEDGFNIKAVNEQMFVITANRRLRVVNLEMRTVVTCTGKLASDSTVEIVTQKCWGVVFSRGRMNLKVYDLTTGKVRCILNGGQKLRLEQFKVSTDGSVAVAFGEKWPVVVYDVIAGTCLHKLFMMGEVDLSYEYAITPDNRFLVQNIMRVPEEQQIENNITYPVIFDLQRGVLVHHLGDWEEQLQVEAEERENDITACDLVVSNTVVVTGHYDLYVRVWDVCKGQLLHRLEGHTHDIANMLWSADGSRLVTHTSQPEENALRVWDATSWQCVASFKIDDKDTMKDVCVFGDASLMVWPYNNMPSHLRLTGMDITPYQVPASTPGRYKESTELIELSFNKEDDQAEDPGDPDTDIDESEDDTEDDDENDGNLSEEFSLKDIPSTKDDGESARTILLDVDPRIDLTPGSSSMQTSARD